MSDLKSKKNECLRQFNNIYVRIENSNARLDDEFYNICSSFFDDDITINMDFPELKYSNKCEKMQAWCQMLNIRTKFSSAGYGYGYISGYKRVYNPQPGYVQSSAPIQHEPLVNNEDDVIKFNSLYTYTNNENDSVELNNIIYNLKLKDEQIELTVRNWLINSNVDEHPCIRSKEININDVIYHIPCLLKYKKQNR